MHTEIEKLRAHMYQNNLGTDNDILLDGKLHRYSTKKSSHRDEWYIGNVISSDFIWCHYGSWRNEQNKFFFHSWETDNQIAYQEYQISKKEIEHAIKENEKEAKNFMLQQWNEASQCTSHPYLEKKQIKPHNCKILDNNLLIPIHDFENNLLSFCKIYPDGTKRHFTGISLKDGFTILGNKESNTYYFAEGFATGASIHEATGNTVLICHGSSNILNIAKIIKNKFPEKNLKLCQDLGDAGEKIAEKFKGDILKPKFKTEHFDLNKYNDFNDILVLYGIEELKKQILNKLPFYTLKEFLSLQIKIPQWICENLIMENSSTFIYGASGVGKSFFTYDLALCIFSGIPFMNKKTISKKVLLIDGEMSNYEIKDRMVKFIQRYENELLLLEPDFNNFKIITNDLLVENNLPIIELYKGTSLLNNHIEDSDVIILDNIEALCGDHPTLENASWKTEAWKPIETWIKYWLFKGKTFILVDHTNKKDELAGSHSKIHLCQTTINIKKTNFPNPECELWFDAYIEKGRHIYGLNKSPWSARLNMNNTPLTDEAKKAMEGLQIKKANGCWELSPISKKAAPK